jgi:RHS repeat-associated protein
LWTCHAVLDTGTTRSLYTLGGEEVAQRTTTRTANEVVYLHSDHLGSVAVTTNAQGQIASGQRYHPWGTLREGDLVNTSLDYTGQRRDDTGLLYYHARSYDPQLGRFLSADSIVPDATGSVVSLDSDVAFAPLTMDFHEPEFLSTLSAEHTAVMEDGFFEREQRAMGPATPQALNRYTYVLNNPVRFEDPTGHVPPIRCWICNIKWGEARSSAGRFFSRVGCFFVGCHVRGSGVYGPTTHEWAEASLMGMVGVRGRAPGRLFRRAGIPMHPHFIDGLVGRAPRGVSERLALRAYQYGRLFWDPAGRKFIRYDPITKIVVVTMKASRGQARTVFTAAKASSRWVPMPWRPGQ